MEKKSKNNKETRNNHKHKGDKNGMCCTNTNTIYPYNTMVCVQYNMDVFSVVDEHRILFFILCYIYIYNINTKIIIKKHAIALGKHTV